MSDLKWIRSSYSSAEAANCVEIAVIPDGGRAVRDSKNPDGAVLVLTAGQWTELVESVLRQKCNERPPNHALFGASRFSSGGNPRPPRKQIIHKSLLER